MTNHTVDETFSAFSASYVMKNNPEEGILMYRHLRRFAALLLCFVLTGCAAEQPDGTDSTLLASPVLPVMAPYPNDEEAAFLYNDAGYHAWLDSVRAQERDNGYTAGLRPFLQRSSSAFLSGAGKENRVYSPLSLYMALAMLAETTAGDTRAEVMALLGQESISSLRTQAADLWNANYRDDGAMTRTLAASLWLNDSAAYHEETIHTLADNYYASVYRGTMGSAAYDAALQTWLDKNTRGLLSQQTRSIHMSPNTLAAIASTVAFSARWGSRFSESQSEQRVFHAPDGQQTCTFMCSSGKGYLFWGEHFQAVRRSFDLGGDMWLILPDEGISPDDLLQDAEALSFLTDASDWAQCDEFLIHLKAPKFDVSSQLELSEELQALGVTDVFAPGADFSPLTGSDDPIFLSQVQHDARVVIDEEGCEAAAYTVMLVMAGAPPQQQSKLGEIDFILDRPFLFVITGADELPLFVGVVNQP